MTTGVDLQDEQRIAGAQQDPVPAGGMPDGGVPATRTKLLEAMNDSRLAARDARLAAAMQQALARWSTSLARIERGEAG